MAGHLGQGLGTWLPSCTSTQQTTLLYGHLGILPVFLRLATLQAHPGRHLQKVRATAALTIPTIVKQPKELSSQG